MLLKSELTFIFDKDNINWTDDMDFNKVIVQSNVRFLEELFKTRGYIYLNEIYQHLNFKWDPNRVNPCLMYGKDGNEIRLIHMDENVDGILFTIWFVSNDD